jgi:phosphonate transport system ATP-binding protein
LADELISNLDPKLSRVILGILKQISREDGITVVVSLDTLELARAYADTLSR